MTAAIPPPVMWAQRANVVFLTFCVEDCKEPEIRIDSDKVFFKGTGGTEKKLHELTINLFKEIDPEKSTKAIRDRVIELILRKKNQGDDDTYWPQLTKEKAKHHWLKVDFNRWRDEDSSGDEAAPDEMGGETPALSDLIRSMEVGKRMKDETSLDDLEPDSDDDDEDEQLPGLE